MLIDNKTKIIFKMPKRKNSNDNQCDSKCFKVDLINNDETVSPYFNGASEVLLSKTELSLLFKKRDSEGKDRLSDSYFNKSCKDLAKSLLGKFLC